MPDQKPVLYQEEGGIALITLNRPQALNTLDMDLLQQLSLLLDEAQTRDSVKALIITGSTDAAFSAGAISNF